MEILGRILSLLSIESLEHLLAKPFDLIAPKRKGFDFEVEEATFSIVNGTLHTNNFHLQGKLADVKAKGSINMVKQDYHLYITIFPYLTAFLPVNLAFTGEPVVTGMIWFVDKIMAVVVNRLIRVNYSVTGPWNNPIYKKIPQLPDETQQKQPAKTGYYKS